MDTEGPISVLDRRPRSSSRDRVITDRLTRQRSPGPSFRRQARRGGSDSGEGQDVIYRIPQPYRTSFSAKHSVTWGKADRSRSLSPTSSLHSDTSYRSAPPVTGTWDKRRPRGRSKSPKRVTYDTRVTVRHSDTEDSMFTELSSHELDDMCDDTPQRPIQSPFSRSLISPKYNEFSRIPPGGSSGVHSSTLRMTPRYREHKQALKDPPDCTPTSATSSRGRHPRSTNVSRDSGLDYSTELRDLSTEITQMQWSPRQNRALRTRPPPLSSPTHHPHHQQRGQGQGSRERGAGMAGQQTRRKTPSPPGILKDSQNSRSGVSEAQQGVISTGNGVLGDGSRSSPLHRTNLARTSPPKSARSDKENDPSASPTKGRHSPDSPAATPDVDTVIARDYEHEQVFSYKRAVKGEYGEDIQRLAEEGLVDALQQQQSQDMGTKENGGIALNSDNDTEKEEEQATQPNNINSSPANTSQGEISPGRGSPTEPGRLTPSKRSISLSITNFLKRFSPHLRRKRSKDRGSKSSSAAGSAQSLTTSEPDTGHDSPSYTRGKSRRSGHFSRSRVRQSFLKLVGKSRSGSKKKAKNQSPSQSMQIPTPSHYTIELQDPDKTLSSDEVDEISNGYVINSTENVGLENGKSSFSSSTNRIMKSIEQNNAAEQDIYRRFKDRHSPRGENASPVTAMNTTTTPGAGHTNLTRPKPLRPNATSDSSPSPSPLDTSASDAHNISMEFFTATDLKAILSPHRDSSPPYPSSSSSAYPGPSSSSDERRSRESSPVRAAPPNSLDVRPSRTIRLLQTSVMSSISGDESIGECSLDANLTSSEPSLLSGNSLSGGSKQVVIPPSLFNSTEGRLSTSGEPDVVKLRRSARKDGGSDKENSVPTLITSPQISSSDPPSPVDPSHKPSYLKLSCAVSGYGKYCRYSTYKDVNKRSPYSSQSSLRSEVSSPEPGMPAEQRSGDELTPEHKNRSDPAGWGRPPRGGNMDTPTSSVNGLPQKFPTGDPAKDGEYFLQHTQFEEDRIRGLSSRAEAHMRSHDLPEEACGRIRSAIGKANLLLSQKCAQFRDLCSNHMHPDPEERETKWEDLQGFWDIIKIQIDSVDDMFAEIELMKQNGWQEIPKVPSRRSSASSSPKSGSISQASTPSATPAHTPGTKRKNIKPNKDTPESSPERTQKARQAAKARDEARKKLLADRRAAMKKAANGNGSNSDVEIFVPEPSKQ